MLFKRATLMLLLLPYLISTKFMVADMFTKALDKGTFIRFRDIIMNNNIPLRETLAAACSNMHGESRKLASRLLGRL